MDLELRFWIVKLVTSTLLPAAIILIGGIAIIDKTRELGKRLKVWKYYKRSNYEYAVGDMGDDDITEILYMNTAVVILTNENED